MPASRGAWSSGACPSPCPPLPGGVGVSRVSWHCGVCGCVTGTALTEGQTAEPRPASPVPASVCLVHVCPGFHYVQDSGARPIWTPPALTGQEAPAQGHKPWEPPIPGLSVGHVTPHRGGFEDLMGQGAREPSGAPGGAVGERGGQSWGSCRRAGASWEPELLEQTFPSWKTPSAY